MNFLDKVTISVKAGDGGNGKLSFRHEKFIAKGGPDGGDGGNGGNVVFKASRNQNTLTAFRYQKELKSEPGRPGGKNRRHGKTGQDLCVEVPVGTLIADSEGRQVVDLIYDNQSVIIAKGGKGGFGNAHFLSSTRQAPKFAEKGELGEDYELELELKMIADVGLVGLPNAGKSTLLSKISNARPEIADYPFTTIKPNLGMVDVDKTKSILFADIPGLIEGAAEGKGLGHDFLRHIERTQVILHLIDAYNDDVAASYKTIRQELEAYSKSLTKRPEVVVLTKIEGLDQEIVDDQINSLKKASKRGTKIMPISSQAGTNLKQLIYLINETLQKQLLKVEPKKLPDDKLPVISLNEDDAYWRVELEDERFVVRGRSIERFAQRTDFNNQEGLQRLKDIMRRMGIMHELKRHKVKPNQIVQVGNDESANFEY
jgi:GTP-binding protein